MNPDNYGHDITISPELWAQFKEALDIGQPIGHKPDYDGMARMMIEQAIGQYIALKQQIKRKK